MADIAAVLLMRSAELNRKKQEIDTLLSLLGGYLFDDHREAVQFRKNYRGGPVPDSMWRVRQHGGKYHLYYMTQSGEVEVAQARPLRADHVDEVRGAMNSLIEGAMVLAPWLRKKMEPLLP